MTALPERPLARRYERHGRGAATTMHFSNGVVSRHAVVHDLAPLLDGTLSSDEVVDALGDRHQLSELYFGIYQLVEHDCIRECVERVPQTSVALAESIGLDPGLVATSIQQKSIAVRGIATQAHVACARVLLQLGFDVRPPDQSKLLVVVTPNYEHPLLRRINSDAIRTGQPWLLVRLGGAVPLVGPLFLPGRSGCWTCLVRRLRLNPPLTPPDWLRRARVTAGDWGRSPGLGLLVCELAKCLTGTRTDALTDAVLVHDAVNGAVDRYEVPRLDGCPDCGRDARPGATQQRARPIEQHAFLVNPLGGIVSSFHILSTEREALAVVVAERHRPRNAPRGWCEERQSCGKGVRIEDARRSALAEAAERASIAFHDHVKTISASQLELGDRAIEPNAWMQYSPAQFRSRLRWNRTEYPTTRVPLPFDRRRVIDWSAVQAVGSDEIRYLPTACLYLYYPARAGAASCVADSNGCAAGPTREDAAGRALLELVERDAVSIWWYNRLRRPGIDLSCHGPSWIGALIEHYEKMERDIWALDLTTDLDIPVVAAISSRRGTHDAITFGFGAGVTMDDAIGRAAAELQQVTVTFTAGAPPGFAYPAYIQRWLVTATLHTHPYLKASGRTDVIPGQIGGLTSDALVRHIASTLCANGMETFVLDHTRPEIGIPVMRAIVPGLRHFWPRFAEGRLYDVPVSTGLLQRPREEHELNPIPMFI